MILIIQVNFLQTLNYEEEVKKKINIDFRVFYLDSTGGKKS